MDIHVLIYQQQYKFNQLIVYLFSIIATALEMFPSSVRLIVGAVKKAVK